MATSAVGITVALLAFVAVVACVLARRARQKVAGDEKKPLTKFRAV